ncbi:MAG: hypothetical protein K2J51_08015 [Alistipes sp.]|nr:hypothetical protein [Alistipes sp.]
MEDLDKEKATSIPSDEELFMREVVKGEADILFLDCYLRDIFGRADD